MMKTLAIIIIGIVILSISGIYVIQSTQNQQIDEILVTNEHEGMCDESIDKNKDSIPDEFEEDVKNESLKIIERVDFSNCIFPNKIAFHYFINSNFTNTDFSNSKITTTIFKNVLIDKSDFSNSTLHGVEFKNATINESNFTNTKFVKNPWENPPFTFNVDNNEYSDWFCSESKCKFLKNSCETCSNLSPVELGIYVKNSEMGLSLRFIDKINDQSDRRDIYKQAVGFYSSNIDKSIFKNVDLSHAIFANSNLFDSLIESSNTFNILFKHTTIKNTKINDEYYIEEIKNGIMDQGNNWKQMMYDEVNKKTQIKDYKIDVNLIHVMDDIPINWSMGMTIFEQSLYVADTDNHRINVYDLDTLKKKFEFTSPISHYCESTHTWAPNNPDCPHTMRNLPTSVTILNEKIFVSYGFQDDIQIFDLNGIFLSKFGSSGNQKGEFDMPMHISASNDLLYIADSGNKRIQVVDSEGQFVKEFSVPISNESDLEISLDIFENKIYVINSKNSDLFIYDLNGNLIKKIILEYDIGNSSIGVENGLIVVSNSNKNTIAIFDLDGVIMNEFGNHGERYGEFDSPRGITVNDGKIYVSDPYNFRIQVFSMELK
jgi:uncharacterized protein YjbI with pentapeptide repeats